MTMVNWNASFEDILSVWRHDFFVFCDVHSSRAKFTVSNVSGKKNHTYLKQINNDYADSPKADKKCDKQIELKQMCDIKDITL